MFKIYNNQSKKISGLNLIDFKKTKIEHVQDALIFYYKNIINI